MLLLTFSLHTMSWEHVWPQNSDNSGFWIYLRSKATFILFIAQRILWATIFLRDCSHCSSHQKIWVKSRFLRIKCGLHWKTHRNSRRKPVYGLFLPNVLRVNYTTRALWTALEPLHHRWRAAKLQHNRRGITWVNHLSHIRFVWPLTVKQSAILVYRKNFTEMRIRIWVLMIRISKRLHFL